MGAPAGSRRSALVMRLMIAWLHLAQPWARVKGRLQGHLHPPLTDRPEVGIAPRPWPRLRELWLTLRLFAGTVAEFGSGENGGWRSLLPMERIDVVVDSSAVGVRKPDPAIYLHALAELGAPAERVAFVDDMEANVEAARAVGMRGVVMGADPAAAMEELRALVDDPEDVTPR